MNQIEMAAPEERGLARAFVREWIDNGLAVYDARGKRLGTVADYDYPGAGFILHAAEAESHLLIPMRFVRKVRRGRVYLSELARNLMGRRR